MQIVAKPHSFSLPQQFALIEGPTLKEIVEKHIPGDAIIQLNGDFIPKEQWQYIKPVENDNIVITTALHGDNFLRTILSILVVAASGFFLGPGGQFALFQGTTAGANFGNALVAGVVAAAGTALINALIPIRPQQAPDEQSPSYSINGARNDARPFGTVPIVLGKHRMTPPLAALPYTEVSGNEEYLRMLVTWGYGPLDITDIRIGNTTLSSDGINADDTFQNAQVETEWGFSVNDQEIDLFPGVVFQESVNAEITAQENVWPFTERTTEEDIDEFSFDIVFPRGYGFVNNKGKIEEYPYHEECTYSYEPDLLGDPVRVETCVKFPYYDFKYKYKKHGTTTWSQEFAVHVDQITKEVIKHTVRVSNLERGQYDVAVRRVYQNYEDDARILDTMLWSYLRSIRNEKPINFREQPVGDYPKKLALTAIRIKATGQLSGVIDNLNGLVQSRAPTWSGTGWDQVTSQTVEGTNPTSNPAALYRWVLLGPGSDRPRDESQIDDEKLGEWYEFCEQNGYEFNQIRDFPASVWDTLSDIASAGRASPTIVDGKWSVIIDKAEKPVVQHFTPRNSWGFSAEKLIPIQPHAFRIRFWNQERDWQVDERIVPDDGYKEGEATPTQFESIEFPGITDPDLVWKFGRYFIAQARLRPEQYTFNADFEHLACQRGDLVLMNHDVTLWGSGAGRVTEVKTDSSENIVGVHVDEEFVVESDKSYNMRFRLEDGSSVITNVTPTDGAGVRTEFDFDPTTENIQVGDLVMFGEINSESQRLIVKSIERGPDFTAKVVCVDESPEIYNADTGTIPEFDSNTTDPVDITQTLPDAPDIVSVEAGTGALLPLGNGAFLPRILVGVEGKGTIPAARNYSVRYRRGNNAWKMVTIGSDESTAILSEVQTGEVYEIQARAISIYNLVGLWSESVYQEVIGELEPPDDVTGLVASQTKYGVKIKWDGVDDVDLRDYEIRVGSSWDTATVLNHINATEWVWEIQGSGTYKIWVAARDFAGIYSENPVSYEIEVIGPSEISLSYYFDGPNVVLEWDRSVSLFAVEDYEIELDNEIYTASMTTSFSLRASWSGNKTINVTPIDIAGNRGPTSSVDVLVVDPTEARNITVQVIDNNVLLNWERPATHSLPIQYYEVFKGSTFLTATEIGEVGGTFSPVFETEGGLFTYWIRAVDTAGNAGPEKSIAVQVNPPPDYVLREIANIDFSLGTHDNTCAIGTALYGPNDSCNQTWESHFEDSNNNWTTIQQQINAGFPLYLQPVPTGVATFTRELDLGAVLPPTVVTMSVNIDIMGGDVDFTKQISYKENVGDAWTDMEVNQTQVFINTFRYIKVTLTFESETGRTGLARVNELLVRLDVKLKTDSGHVEVTSNPTAVTFGVDFIDVQSITLTPGTLTSTSSSSGVPMYAVYDFDDSPYPTGFDIYLYDLNGDLTTGTVSWTARGV